MFEIDTPLSSIGSEALRVPGELPAVRPTGREIAQIQTFPDYSELLHEWVGSDGGHIVVVPPEEGSEQYSDSTRYAGHVVGSDGMVTKRFEYRAEPPGPISQATARALGWLMNEKVAPRGWLSGRIIPESNGA